MKKSRAVLGPCARGEVLILSVSLWEEGDNYPFMNREAIQPDRT
jgi:hypothetical protein